MKKPKLCIDCKHCFIASETLIYLCKHENAIMVGVVTGEENYPCCAFERAEQDHTVSRKRCGIEGDNWEPKPVLHEAPEPKRISLWARVFGADPT